MDETDRAIINALQGGFPICERPFEAAAATLGLSEACLIDRIARMRQAGILSRFGPLINADRFGGHVTLAALAVPPDRFDEVADIVNSFPEIAHNYARDHRLNMWFVAAAASHDEVAKVLAEITARTGLQVHDMPKLQEFHVGLRLEA